VHRVEAIEVWRIEPALLDAMEARIDRNTSFELVRTDDQLYVTFEGAPPLRGALERASLVEP
jgi:hypothetical protein